MKNTPYRVEKYLRARTIGVAAEAIARALGVSKSLVSLIMRDLVAAGKVNTQRVLVSGRGQPTLIYMWNRGK